MSSTISAGNLNSYGEFTLCHCHSVLPQASSLLREANQKLQDTNDGLRTVVDVGSIHSPHLSGRHEFAHLISPEILRSASDVELAEKLYHPIKKYNIRKHRQEKATLNKLCHDREGTSIYNLQPVSN